MDNDYRRIDLTFILVGIIGFEGVVGVAAAQKPHGYYLSNRVHTCLEVALRYFLLVNLHLLTNLYLVA
jgi:hypothetical protein